MPDTEDLKQKVELDTSGPAMDVDVPESFEENFSLKVSNNAFRKPIKSFLCSGLMAPIGLFGSPDNLHASMYISSRVSDSRTNADCSCFIKKG